MDFLKEIVKLEWLRKVTAREFFLVALFLVLASVVVILIPDDLLKAWGATSLIGQLRPYFGIAGVLGVILFLTILLAKLQELLQHRRTQKRIQNLLHNLTNHQKNILKIYSDSKDKTRYFQVDDGVVNDLMEKGVITRSSEPTTMRGYRGLICAYTLNDWAWNYLRKHPELLSDGSHTTKEQDAIAKENQS